MPPNSFDIVTRVVDHYGDAGVALRLARQLHREHGSGVTLWIDDLDTLARIAPGLDPACADQRYGGLRIRRLDDAAAPGAEAAAVIEMFGCGLPPGSLAAMAQRARPPVWVVLEYLSAEAWVDDAHGKPSPHPATGLPRWFYFPGFTPATGGLLREQDLLAQGETLAGAERSASWAPFGLEAAARDAFCIFLFCYPDAALPALFDAWAQGDRRILCAVPQGVGGEAVRAIAGDAGPIRVRGRLTLAIVPFTDQDGFDRRLRASDLCIVRGEDSFLRAQWAMRPFAWHIYPQSERAHLRKLDAFLARYAAGLEAGAASATREFWFAFNEADGRRTADAWAPFLAAQPALRAHAGAWARGLAAQADLASRLVAFVLGKQP